MDIFKVKKYFIASKPIKRIDLIDHLKGIKNFKFSKKRVDLRGTFTRGIDFLSPPFSIMLRTKFEFQKDILVGFEMSLNFLGKFILTGYLFIGIYLTIIAMMQSEFGHQLGTGITGLGFLSAFFIVKYFLKSEIESIKKRLKFD